MKFKKKQYWNPVLLFINSSKSNLVGVISLGFFDSSDLAKDIDARSFIPVKE